MLVLILCALRKAYLQGTASEVGSDLAWLMTPTEFESLCGLADVPERRFLEQIRHEARRLAPIRTQREIVGHLMMHGSAATVVAFTLSRNQVGMLKVIESLDPHVIDTITQTHVNYLRQQQASAAY